ncbi:MAG: hypothetical protein JO180_07355 [Gemmatirosa sp.]|nr:hypothetical protein [Gemmatirosa sp.]
MHKKSPRGVPDFSRHTPTPREAGAPGSHAPTPEGKRAAPPAPRPAAKPQSTNAKSGRRGQ